MVQNGEFERAALLIQPKAAIPFFYMKDSPKVVLYVKTTRARDITYF